MTKTVKTKKTMIRLTVKQKLLLWLPVIAWMFVIFYFSSMQTPAVTRVLWTEFVIKKTAHVIEYFILTTLTLRACLGWGVVGKRSSIIAFWLSVVFALTDEFHQSFTPGREPKVRDVVIDVFASGLAVVFWLKYVLPAKERFWLLAKKVMFLYT